MNLNQIYLAAVASASTVVAVEVYFKENDSSRPAMPVAKQPRNAPEAPWAIDNRASHINNVDFKRRPVAAAPVKAERDVFTYLAPSAYALKDDDAVIVVNDRTGKVSVGYVHAVVPIDLDKLNAVAMQYGHQHADGFFWKWIVAPVDFTKYNDLNKAREAFLDRAVSIEGNKRAKEMREKLAETYGSASAVDELFDSVLTVPVDKAE